MSGAETALTGASPPEIRLWQHIISIHTVRTPRRFQFADQAYYLMLILPTRPILMYS